MKVKTEALPTELPLEDDGEIQVIDMPADPKKNDYEKKKKENIEKNKVLLEAMLGNHDEGVDALKGKANQSRKKNDKERMSAAE